MPNKVPILSKEVYDTFTNTVTNEYKNDKEFIKKHLPKIKEDNPVVAQAILEWASELEGEMLARVVLGMIIVYKLLAIQAEVDELEES